MTASRLAALLDQATPGPWSDPEWGGLVVDGDENPVAYHVLSRNARLIALAPDLARLLVDMAAWVQYVREGNCGHISDEGHEDSRVLLARFAALDEKAGGA